MAVRPADLSQALLDIQPTIVHFSGHGTATGALCFEDVLGNSHPIEPDALAALFEQFAAQVDCVVLNACYSETQARAIAEHIDRVIGVSHEIGDKAAIAFTIGFYQALVAGRSIEESYKLGCVQVRLQGAPRSLTPVLVKGMRESKSSEGTPPGRDDVLNSKAMIPRIHEQGGDMKDEEITADSAAIIHSFLGAGEDWPDQTDLIPSDDVTSFYPLPWLNPEGRQALEIAVGESLRVGHFWLGVEFLLMGLSKQEGTAFRNVLLEMDIRPKDLRSLLRGAVGSVAGKNWQARDLVTIGERRLPHVREIDPDLLRQSFEAGGEQPLTATPRLMTVLKDAVKLAGEGKIGHNHLLWIALRHHRSLAVLLLLKKASRAGWSPERLMERVAGLVGRSHEDLRENVPRLPDALPYLEVLSGPLDGHVVALEDETIWERVGKGPLTFPWDTELGMPQARLFPKGRGWWLESYPASHGTYFFNRGKRIEGKTRLKTGDVLRAHKTWLLIGQVE